jgi:hypothetical protein
VSAKDLAELRDLNVPCVTRFELERGVRPTDAQIYLRSTSDSGTTVMICRVDTSHPRNDGTDGRDAHSRATLVAISPTGSVVTFHIRQVNLPDTIYALAKILADLMAEGRARKRKPNDSEGSLLP